MGYIIKEIFRTLQGEGRYSGRAAVFCRFSGCNLWSGRESDRAWAVCQFCDTDFIGGDRFNNAESVVAALSAHWGTARNHQFVVFTGGEPLLQLDQALIDACHAAGFEIAVETNGTVVAPSGIDWLTVSPKAGAPFLQRSGNELKLVYPQPGLEPADLSALPFSEFWLQPLDGPARDANTAAAVAWCMDNPPWRLSLQTHKIIGIP
ncbi:MAG: 7-carboxy-7-deazaguanine synthase [Rhodospirillaceae bacterium]